MARRVVAQIEGNEIPLTPRQFRAIRDGADTGTDVIAKLRLAISDHNDRLGL